MLKHNICYDHKSTVLNKMTNEAYENAMRQCPRN